MLNLKNVTCFAIDNTTRLSNTIKALYTCMNVASFGEVKLVTSNRNVAKYKDNLSKDNIIVEEEIFPIENIDDYNRYILFDLYKQINTEYVLIVQDHAFIINPNAWSDSFLEYDYIGAPWPIRPNAFITPFGKRIRVGNGGFSLRSQKVLRIPSEHQIPFYVADAPDFYNMFGCRNTNEDGNICVHNRHIFEAHGCKFAPLDVAKYFSYESPVPENQGIIPFGFHITLPPNIEYE